MDKKIAIAENNYLFYFISRDRFSTIFRLKKALPIAGNNYLFFLFGGGYLITSSGYTKAIIRLYRAIHGGLYLHLIFE